MKDRTGIEVKIAGDRNCGTYKARLLKRRKDLEVEDFPEERIYEAEITEIVNNEYDLEVGSKIFVLKTDEAMDNMTMDEKDFWGVIEPCCEEA